MARPRAWGQAITSTVTVRTTASSTSPSSDQTTNVTTAGRGGDVEEQRGEAVGERLGPAAAGLGVGDEALDAGERGVVADGVDPDPERRSRSTTVPATTRSPRPWRPAATRR